MHDLDQLTGRDPVQRIECTVRVAPLVDLQTPGQRRRPAVKLLVEVVADPADRLSQHDAGRDRIAEGRQRDTLSPASNPCADAAERHRPPDTKTALLDLEGRDQTRTARPEIRRPVRENVIEP